MTEFIGGIREQYYHIKELSGETYSSPIKPRQGEVARFWQDSPSHVGPYKNAVDIIIPDPRENPLPVYAPQDGEIVDLVQHNTKWGATEEFKGFLNYVTVKVNGREFYEIAHIGMGSCRDESGQVLKIGDRVQKGQVIAQTGVNGWMTDPRHLHFMVGRWTNKAKGEFKSLKIRFKG